MEKVCRTNMKFVTTFLPHECEFWKNNCRGRLKYYSMSFKKCFLKFRIILWIISFFDNQDIFSKMWTLLQFLNKFEKGYIFLHLQINFKNHEMRCEQMWSTIGEYDFFSRCNARALLLVYIKLDCILYTHLTNGTTDFQDIIYLRILVVC